MIQLNFFLVIQAYLLTTLLDEIFDPYVQNWIEKIIIEIIRIFLLFFLLFFFFFFLLIFIFYLFFYFFFFKNVSFYRWRKMNTSFVIIFLFNFVRNKFELSFVQFLFSLFWGKFNFFSFHYIWIHYVDLWFFLPFEFHLLINCITKFIVFFILGVLS